MRMSFMVVSSWLAFLAGCAPPKPDVVFDTTFPTKQIMAHIINPAAVGLWGRAGTWEDENGVEDLAPDTPDQWAEAENEAAIVAEGGNLLLLPGRIRVLEEGDNGDWSRFALQLVAQAREVKIATEARDKERMFDAGGDLYQVCVACHEKYYVPFLEEGETTAAPRKND
ncbi:MAG: hypothetical protein Q8R02_13640 [Hyphomonadaceae bacterium]|nr:hypothetical protein [Hyphomonadaceae bacterium]